MPPSSKRNKSSWANKSYCQICKRKTSESLIRSNKNFARRDVFEKAGLNEKIYINNSLSNYNKYLWGKAKALLQKNLISKFWCSSIGMGIREHNRN